MDHQKKVLLFYVWASILAKTFGRDEGKRALVFADVLNMENASFYFLWINKHILKSLVNFVALRVVWVKVFAIFLRYVPQDLKEVKAEE